MKNLKKFVTLSAAIVASALLTPALASAQDMAYASGADQQIAGTVSSIDGTWNITVNDASGFSDSIALHQGTFINPTGLTLEPGMNVTIEGFADGSSFDAIEIDTPYQYTGPAPVAVYYGPGAWYPGYAQGWGPSFTLAFNSGNRQFEQRSFTVGGQVRRAMTPPAGYETRPHGFIGNVNVNANTSQRRTAFAPQQQPQRAYTAPQQAQPRSFAAPQQAQPRNYAATRQQMPQARSAPVAQRGGQERGGNGEHNR